MAVNRRLIIDQWSPLSHKESIGQPGTFVPDRWLAPTWVPATEQRRLAAYRVLAAYRENVARLTLPSTVDDLDRDQRREYGDPTAFSNRIVASVLGDGWTVAVDGADDELFEGPRLPPKPDPAPAGATPLEQTIAAARAKAWDAEAESIVARWAADLEAQPALRQRQEDLRRWLDDHQVAARIDEAEHDAVDLGDGVYVLWPQQGDWPRVEVYDPGFYFPELDTAEQGGFPTRVHIAWEYAEDGGLEPTHVQRLTWELVDLTVLHTTVDRRRGLVWVGPDGQPLPDGQLPAFTEGTTVDAEGNVVRTLPWHGPDDQPATHTCVFSDGTWRLGDIGSADVYTLPPDRATWRARRVDLGCDFVTVVHEPNTSNGKEHYGRSVIAHVAQILDDLATTDTRTMGASQFLGAPALALSGGEASPQAPPVLAPGMIYNGDLTALDLSAGIEKLMALDAELQRRWWQNLGAPRELMGQVDSSTTSGIHLALKFAPWAQVVSALRLGRSFKYRLFLKMAQRLAQLAVRPDGTPVLEPGPTPTARLVFGPFLPANQLEVLGMVKDGVTGHVLSIETAVQMLVGAGFPIDDARAELERILAEDTAGAVAVADALAGAPGAAAVVADRLGVADRVSDPAPAAPPVPLPPAGP